MAECLCPKHPRETGKVQGPGVPGTTEKPGHCPAALRFIRKERGSEPFVLKATKFPNPLDLQIHLQCTDNGRELGKMSVKTTGKTASCRPTEDKPLHSTKRKPDTDFSGSLSH